MRAPSAFLDFAGSVLICAMLYTLWVPFHVWNSKTFWSGHVLGSELNGTIVDMLKWPVSLSQQRELIESNSMFDIADDFSRDDAIFANLEECRNAVQASLSEHRFPQRFAQSRIPCTRQWLRRGELLLEFGYLPPEPNTLSWPETEREEQRRFDQALEKASLLAARQGSDLSNRVNAHIDESRSQNQNLEERHSGEIERTLMLWCVFSVIWLAPLTLCGILFWFALRRRTAQLITPTDHPQATPRPADGG